MTVRVQVAGAASGLPEALRVQQVIAVTRPQANGAFYLPPSMFARVQISMGFPNGLPLAAGGFYSWRAEVDGQHHLSWGASFHVLGAPPPPVFGGRWGPPASLASFRRQGSSESTGTHSRRRLGLASWVLPSRSADIQLADTQPALTVTEVICTGSLGLPPPAWLEPSSPAAATFATTSTPLVMVPNGVYCGGSGVSL